MVEADLDIQQQTFTLEVVVTNSFALSGGRSKLTYNLIATSRVQQRMVDSTMVADYFALKLVSW